MGAPSQDEAPTKATCYVHQRLLGRFFIVSSRSSGRQKSPALSAALDGTKKIIAIVVLRPGNTRKMCHRDELVVHPLMGILLATFTRPVQLLSLIQR